MMFFSNLKLGTIGANKKHAHYGINIPLKSVTATGDWHS